MDYKYKHKYVDACEIIAGGAAFVPNNLKGCTYNILFKNAESRENITYVFQTG